MNDDAKLLRAARISRWAALLSLVVFVALVAASVFSLGIIQRTIKDQRATSLKLADHNRGLEAEIARKESALAILNRQVAPTERVASNRIKVQSLPKPRLEPDDIKPQVRAVPKQTKDDQGQNLFDFTLWIEAQPALREKIAQVKYDLNHASFREPTMTSTNARDGFAVHYVGWGALRLVTITVTMKDGSTRTRYFDMVEQLGW